VTNQPPHPPTGPERAVTPANRQLRRFAAFTLLPLFATLAALAIYGLITNALNTRSLSQPIPNGITTTGTIVNYRTSTDPKTGTTYHPEDTFHATNGRTYTIFGPRGGHRPVIGATVTISYNPRNPAQAHDLTSDNDWDANLIVCGSMAFLVAAAIAIGTRIDRRRRKRLQDSHRQQ
jgi:hypothetical protein